MGPLEKSSLPPHVLIFPLPVQGHVNSMLKLAELLSLAAVHVTFLLSDFSHRRLLRHTDIHSRFTRYPRFRFETISDGLPDDHPRAGERIFEMMYSIKNVTGPLFKEMMVATGCLSSDGRRPLTCIIADGVLSFAGDFAFEKGIPLIYFRTIGACAFWAYFCFQEIIEAGEVPLQDPEMELNASNIGSLQLCTPATKVYLAWKDFFGAGTCLGSFGSMKYPTHDYKYSKLRPDKLFEQAIIVNTFEDLEGPVLSNIRTALPNCFTIGPLHSHLKSRLPEEKTTTTPPSLASSSFWEEDRSCIEWLDGKPPKSVVYVSFGSIAVLTREQLMEFWYGLVNSGQHFLWVMRPDSITGKDGESQIPAEISEGTKERGYMAEWAPQEEVLNHHAIGGFLTHCGWNSTLESIVAGVPMICWPYFADQMINSRFVSEVWKIGLDMKDTCDRVVIEKMVRDLMVVRKDEFIQSADRMPKMAREAVSEGGSSYYNLDRLIEYIRSMVA